MNIENQTVQKVLKAVGLLCILLAIYVLILSFNAIKQNHYIGGGVPSSNVITVTGTGEVNAKPDIAEFSFTVLEERKDVDSAQQAAAEKVNAAIKFLKDNRVDEKDIKTLGFNVNPRYGYGAVKPIPSIAPNSAVSYPYPGPDGTRTQVGVEVSETVNVKVRDTAQAGELLAGITNLGIQNVSGVSLTIDDESKLQRESRQKAITDAKEKAEELADDLDVDLVRIVNFSENGNPVYPMYRDAAFSATESAAPKAIPEIPTGENTITSYVTITYEIQ